MTLPQEDHRLREALAALDRGWIPTPLDGKIPVSKRWNLLSVPTERDVEQWIREGRNIGVRTGAISGIVVIDEDPKNGGAIGHLLQSVGMECLPPTPTVITGSGGRHYYFRYPRGAKIGNSSRELQSPGIDVRGEGGQVVYPGSIHPETGQVYAWAPTLSPDDVELAELPQPILDRLTRKRGYADAALENEVNRVKAAPEGERNNALNRAAFSLGQLVGGGALDEQAVITALLAASPLPPREAEATIRSGLDSGKGKPRRPPQAITASNAILIPGAHITDQAEYVEIGNDDFADAVLEALPLDGIYRRTGVSGELVGEPGRRAFVPISPDRMRILVDRHVRLAKWVQRKKDDSSALIYQTCSKDWANVILACAQTHPQIREITTLTNYPIYTDRGRAKPGWDAGIFYDEPPDLAAIVPDATNAAAVLEDLVVDFPFATRADRENFFGLLMTPILRPFIDGNVPMHLIMASLERTGKSKLCEDVWGGIIQGKPTPAMQLTARDEERDKRITTLLLQGDTMVHLDNLTQFVDSAALASLITASTYAGRILGKNENATLSNRLTIVGSGNNVRATGEIAKRIVPIVLQPRNDEPERRGDFQHPDLRQHVRECRRPILAAILGMIDAWVDAGRPAGTERLGGFESWAATVGGVLQMHGFNRWGKNMRSWQRQADPDGTDLKTLADAWWVEYGEKPVSATQVYDLVTKLGLFQWVLVKAKGPAGAVVSFTRGVLTRNINRPVGGSTIRQMQSGGRTVYYLDRESFDFETAELTS